MVPAAFVTLDALPLTPNGKLDRARCRRPSTGAIRPRAGRGRPRSARCAPCSPSPGLAEVGADDEFFDLGGHSFLAARLVGRIRDEMAATCRCARTSTPRHRRRSPRLLTGEAAVEGDSTGTLLPLRARGSAAPLFFLHPGGGFSWCYSGLVRHLGADVPVYGVQARGLDGTGPLPASMDEMVEDYLARIRSVQPHGPYRLAGWSFGGLTAQALARPDAKGGRGGRELAVLDSYPPGEHSDHSEPVEHEVVANNLRAMDSPSTWPNS
ncbi:hypothetical protein GCM10017744_009380 [Streptomyces antimycoticus]